MLEHKNIDSHLNKTTQTQTQQRLYISSPITSHKLHKKSNILRYIHNDNYSKL